jgi:hypothetical protein
LAKKRKHLRDIATTEHGASAAEEALPVTSAVRPDLLEGLIVDGNRAIAEGTGLRKE